MAVTTGHVGEEEKKADGDDDRVMGRSEEKTPGNKREGKVEARGR